MKAVILAGGKGTRLRPLTCNTPKPMVPLLDRPVMEYGIELLQRHGIDEIVVTVQYLPDVIRHYFGDGADFGVRLHYAEEDRPLGTAGSVKQAEQLLDETFIVISGDALTDFDLSEAVAFHRTQNAAVTLVLTRVESPLEFGVVMTGEDGRVVRFLEKPSWGEVFSDTVNTGIYIIEPHVLAYMEKGRETDFSKDLFPLLMEQGQRICGYVASGYWSDIGNLVQYRQTQFDMLDGKVDVSMRATEILPRIWVGERVKIGSPVALNGPVFIGSDSVVEDDAALGEYSVIGHGSLIHAHASVEKSVLWNNALVGDGAEVNGAMLGRNVVLGESVSVRDGSVLGDGCRIGRNSVIQPGVSLWPGKWIESSVRIHHSMILGERRPRNLFGDEGVKGMPYAEATTLFAGKLALAYATTLPTGSTVTIGCDASPYAAVLARTLSAGLHASSIHTLELGTVTAPVSRHTTYHHADCSGGVHVRRVADTEGEQYLIAFWDAAGLPLNKATERKIENAYAQEDSRKVSSAEVGRAVRDHEAVSRYRKHLIELAEPSQIRPKEYSVVVAYDYRNMKGVVPETLEWLGCSIIQLYAKAGARDIASMVKLSGADIGVRLGSDGELLALADETGEIVPEELVFVLQLLLQLERSSEVLHVPVNAPDIVESLGRRYGVQIVRTKTDFRSRMAMGGLDGFHPSFDGLYMLIQLMRMMTVQGQSLSELVGSVPLFSLSRMTVDCPWHEKGKIMRCLMEEVKDANVDLIDGIKIHHQSGGWTLIRPDGDEPHVSIVVQAPTPEAAAATAAEYARKIEGYRLRTSV